VIPADILFRNRKPGKFAFLPRRAVPIVIS
jgi:hypothetical protein